jgi:osmotically-inducible protein OsmY
MSNHEQTVKEVLAALEHDPRVDLHHDPVMARYNDGVLTLEGESPNIASKKIILEIAAAVTGVTGIVDRLRVTPAEAMEDGAIRDHVSDAILQEPVFQEYSIRVNVKNIWESVREAPGRPVGIIEIEVGDGIVTLNGRVGSLCHKRLAGVLAWWIPGSRDVVNGLEVDPPEEDNDDEVVDAVRLVLEKDPFVNASQIRVTCHDYAVTLEGLVPKPLEREMAEADAWYVFRVGNVINKIESSE